MRSQCRNRYPVFMVALMAFAIQSDVCWATADALLSDIFEKPVVANAIEDDRLQEQRGKFVGKSGAETFFGLTLSSHIEDPLGHIIDVSLGVTATRHNDRLIPRFKRDIRYSRAADGDSDTRHDLNSYTPTTPQGLDTVSGFVQSIVVGGHANDVKQRADISVLDQVSGGANTGDFSSTEIGAEIGQLTIQPHRDVTIGSTIETGAIGFDVTLHGVGTVKQSIRNGHVGQHVSLAHDGVVVRQNLEITTGPLPSLEQRGSRTMMELMRGLR